MMLKLKQNLQKFAQIFLLENSFADAALKYSKDYLSGANGGSLGYAFPETYAPQFAQTVVQSKQGVISAPFKTEFGWHILEVTGMRDGDLTAEAYAQKAYEHLVNSQLQDATKTGLNALRKKQISNILINDLIFKRKGLNCPFCCFLFSLSYIL